MVKCAVMTCIALSLLISMIILHSAQAVTVTTVTATTMIAHNTGGFGAQPSIGLFGVSAAGIGDIDNDGVEDVAAGSFFDSTNGNARGAVYILRLNADGTVKATTKIAHQTGGFGNLANGDNFGHSVALIGDIDNNGIEDIAVGAHADDTGGTNKGALHIIRFDSAASSPDLRPAPSPRTVPAPEPVPRPR